MNNRLKSLKAIRDHIDAVLLQEDKSILPIEDATKELIRLLKEGDIKKLDNFFFKHSKTFNMAYKRKNPTPQNLIEQDQLNKIINATPEQKGTVIKLLEKGNALKTIGIIDPVKVNDISQITKKFVIAGTLYISLGIAVLKIVLPKVASNVWSEMYNAMKRKDWKKCLSLLSNIKVGEAFISVTGLICILVGISCFVMLGYEHYKNMNDNSVVLMNRDWNNNNNISIVIKSFQAVSDIGLKPFEYLADIFYKASEEPSL